MSGCACPLGRVSHPDIPAELIPCPFPAASDTDIHEHDGLCRLCRTDPKCITARARLEVN